MTYLYTILHMDPYRAICDLKWPLWSLKMAIFGHQKPHIRLKTAHIYYGHQITEFDTQHDILTYKFEYGPLQGHFWPKMDHIGA